MSVTRRRFLQGTAATGAVAATSVAVSESASAELTQSAMDQYGDGTDISSTFFATASVEEYGTYAAPGSDGDLWPSCWADDDHLYTSNGDGRGFSDLPFTDVVFNRTSGTPETGITGERLGASDDLGNIWADPEQYNRKPTGLICVDGVMYLAIQDLKRGDRAFDDAPNASISRSDDHGATWQKTSTPMFTDHRFTTIFFLDFGKDSHYSIPALGARDGQYVYAYGLDWNWRESSTGTVPDPVDLYLARVHKTKVQDRSAWRFWSNGTWNADITTKTPVLHDDRRRYVDRRDGNAGGLTVTTQGGVLYNHRFRRYIYTSWTNPTWEFYEAPKPWGPWRRFLCHQWGLVPWTFATDPNPKNGGYGTSIPAKFVSEDGRTMWVQSNWWTGQFPTPEANYNFNLRRLKVTPYANQTPIAQAGNLAVTGADATHIGVCAHFGNWAYLSDGDTSKSEDSFDGTNKLVDYWGYTFSKPYKIGSVAYTTGKMYDDGGWFSAYSGGLRVQVRQRFRWVDVAGVTVTPMYPHDNSAGDFTTYTFSFPQTWGDGVRIVGEPGGAAHFTSIAELSVQM